MILPSVKKYSRRHRFAAQPARLTAGVTYRSQMSASLSAFLLVTAGRSGSRPTGYRCPAGACPRAPSAATEMDWRSLSVADYLNDSVRSGSPRVDGGPSLDESRDSIRP